LLAAFKNLTTISFLSSLQSGQSMAGVAGENGSTAANREGRIELPGFEERGGILKLKDLSVAQDVQDPSPENDAQKVQQAGAARRDDAYRPLVLRGGWFMVISHENTHVSDRSSADSQAA
jgi:hypothetical protein